MVTRSVRKLLGAQIGLCRHARRAAGRVAREELVGGGESCVAAGEGAAVGLVLAGGRRVATGCLPRSSRTSVAFDKLS